MIPTRRAEDLFAGWWALIEALGAVPRVLVWDGEGAVGRWRAGRVELTAECHGVPRHAGHEGASSASRPIRRPRAWSNAANDYLETLVPARPAGSPARPTSTPSCRVAGGGEHPAAAGAGVRPDRADRRGPGGDARAAAGRAGRSGGGLRPGCPGTTTCGWTPTTTRCTPAVIGRRIEVVADLDRVRVFCDGAGGGRPRAVLGQAPDHHRPGARGRGQARCAGTRVGIAAPGGRARGASSGAWPTTTPRSARRRRREVA